MNNMKEEIEAASNDNHLRNYWIKKEYHNKEQDTLTDWVNLQKARKVENKGFNAVMTKLHPGNFGCNKTLHKWKKRANNKYPRCRQNGEI